MTLLWLSLWLTSVIAVGALAFIYGHTEGFLAGIAFATRAHKRKVREQEEPSA